MKRLTLINIHRSGTRYNPDEAKPPAVQLLAKTAAALTATPSVPPTAVVAARKKSAPGRKDSQRVSEGDEDLEGGTYESKLIVLVYNQACVGGGRRHISGTQGP